MSYIKRIFLISTVLYITITTAFSGEFDFQTIEPKLQWDTWLGQTTITLGIGPRQVQRKGLH